MGAIAHPRTEQDMSSQDRAERKAAADRIGRYHEAQLRLLLSSTCVTASLDSMRERSMGPT